MNIEHRIMNEKLKTTQHTGMTDRIREAAGALNGRKWFSRHEVFNQAEVMLSERSGFFDCWNELRKRGELVKLGPEKYRYDPEKAARADVRIRIFRAMHVKGAFCAADIAKLSEADDSYVRAVIRVMVKDGWLEFTGKKGRVKFFRVRNSEKFYLEYVK